MAGFAETFRVKKRASVLGQEDMRLIHEAGLEVMETVGVRIHSKVARDSLRKAGATVDESTSIVKLPADLTRSLISKVPQTIVLAAREKEFDLSLDGTHSYYTTDGCGVMVWEQKTRTRRLSLLQDIKDTAVIADYLPHCSIYEPMVVASDVPQKVHVVTAMKEAFKISRKHIESESTSNPEEAKLQVEMAAEIVGGIEELRKRHILSAMVCTMSPLTLDGNATDAAMVWAEAHVPVHITGMAQMGVSGPATIAGDLVVNHAETLALAAAMQAHSPGSPVIYGSVLSNMNPRTGAIQLASPEALTLCVCAHDMAKYLKMPSASGGIGSNAKTPGIQSTMENTMLALTSTMMAQEISNGIGLLDCSTVLSYEQMMIDEEMIARALTCAREIPVTKETIGLDLIKNVGILGIGKKKGSYLGERSTMVEARKFYQSMLFPGDTFEQWEAKGKKDELTLAKEKADWILKNHQPVMLDGDISARLDKLVKEAGDN
ncbi:MAG: trimethylamine methyltransferase family protein [Candidatus Thermoplasmatota archaeon]|nr:trimethylamine methyltransferase family protein [Candidatus Thermoplasmatota archaeon]